MRDFFSNCTIYVATSPSGKQYVGQTVQTFEDRINSHKSSSSNCTLLKYAIRKYGFDNLSLFSEFINFGKERPSFSKPPNANPNGIPLSPDAG